MVLTLENLEYIFRCIPGNRAIYQVVDGKLKTLFFSAGLPQNSAISEAEYRACIQKDALAVVLPQDREGVRQSLQGLFQGEAEEGTCVYRIFHKTRGFSWVRASARVLGKLDDHLVVGVSFFHRLQEDEIYEKILDQSVRMVFVCDCQTQELLYANQTAREQIGRLTDGEESSWYQQVLPVEISAGWCQIADLELGRTYTDEVYDRRTHRWLSISRQKLSWCGHLACLHFVEDVTRHKVEEEKSRELAAAKKANRMKSVFLSNVSHDMRTPLQGILGFVEMAVQSRDIDQIKDYLSKIRVSGDVLLALMDDTLDLSRIESGKIVWEAAAIDSRELIDYVLVPVQAAAEAKQIEFLTVVDWKKLGMIWIDRQKMQKILLHLLSNAVKFTSPGGQIEFRLEMVSRKQGDDWKITVRDTGVGIGPDFLPRVFEPFAQERAVQGTGLGLAIVHQLVAFMGGEIAVRSEPGQGTEFTVKLFIESAQGHGTFVKPSPALTDGTLLSGQHMLICEDNALNREIVENLLQNQGIEVTSAADGAEGVRLFREAPVGTYDAVLMDLRMPVMDGFAASAAIRALSRPDASQVPILAMSADVYAEDVERCLRAGMDGHLPKPLDIVRLFQMLSEKSRSRRSGM